MKENSNLKALQILAFLSLIFAFYYAAFLYHDYEVVDIPKTSPIYGYRTYLDIIALFLIGIMLFWIVIVVDYFVFYFILGKDFQNDILIAITKSNLPLVFWIPYWTIIRLIFSGSYYPAGIIWIGYVHFFMFIGVHYLIYFLSLSKTTSFNNSNIKFRIGSIILIIIVIFYIILGLSVLPLLLGDTLREFLILTF